MQSSATKTDVIELEGSFDDFHRSSTIKPTRLVFFTGAFMVFQMVAVKLVGFEVAIPLWYVYFGAFLLGPTLLIFGLALLKPKYQYLSRLFYVVTCIFGWTAATVLMLSVPWLNARPMYIEAIYLILVSIYFFSPLRLPQTLIVGLLPSVVVAAVIVYYSDQAINSIYALSFLLAFNVFGIAARYAADRYLQRIYELQLKLSNLAHNDPLTQLPNRRGFAQHIKDINQTKSELAPTGYAFFVFDLDNFKDYNDRYGHPAGDRLLQAIASQLLALTNNNKQAYASRLGGDEFAALWPCHNEDSAAELAIQWRKKLKALIDQDAKKRPSRLDLSIGVAWQDGSQNVNMNTLYANSDKALYEAKFVRKTEVLNPAVKAAS